MLPDAALVSISVSPPSVLLQATEGRRPNREDQGRGR